MTPEERMVAVRKFKPELASINMGSFNFGLFPIMDKIKEYKYDWEEKYLERSKDNIFKNTFYDQERIFKIMKDNGTKPELECYDVGHLYNTAYWVDKGAIDSPIWIQLIMGIMGAIQPSVENLLFMKNTADKLFGKDCVWSVLPTGRHEFNLCTVGAVMGGNVRVGMEDNLYLGKGVLAKSNAEMVTKMARILEGARLRTRNPQRDSGHFEAERKRTHKIWIRLYTTTSNPFSFVIPGLTRNPAFSWILLCRNAVLCCD